jgi:hypothetical protein
VALAVGIGVWVLAGGLGNRKHQPAGERAAAPRLALAQTPAIGVSCKLPNDISCDRVGVAVWLKHPTSSLSVSVAGRPVKMRVPCGRGIGMERCNTYCRHVVRDQPCGTFFLGFLRPAGLLNGPLKVIPDLGHRWLGYNPPRALLRLRGANGAEATLKVPLASGWG